MLDLKLRGTLPGNSTSRLADRFTRLHFTQGSRFTGQLAGSQEVQEAIYRLRYDAYLSCGHIADTGDGRLHDEFDNDAISKTVVIFKEDSVVASARSCLLDMATHSIPGYSLPSATVFLPEMTRAMEAAQVLGRPLRAIEITKLVCDTDCVDSNGLILMLFKLLSYVIMDFDADLIFASVCDSHVKFYQRIGFEKISTPRVWPGLQDVSVQLLVCTRAVHQTIQKGLPRILAARSNDPVYQRFMLGDRISIFPEVATPLLLRDVSPIKPGLETMPTKAVRSVEAIAE